MTKPELYQAYARTSDTVLIYTEKREFEALGTKCHDARTFSDVDLALDVCMAELRDYPDTVLKTWITVWNEEEQDWERLNQRDYYREDMFTYYEIIRTETGVTN